MGCVKTAFAFSLLAVTRVTDPGTPEVIVSALNSSAFEIHKYFSNFVLAHIRIIP